MVGGCAAHESGSLTPGALTPPPAWWEWVPVLLTHCTGPTWAQWVPLSEDGSCSHHKHCFCYFLMARWAVREHSLWTILGCGDQPSWTSLIQTHSQRSGHCCADHFHWPNLLTQTLAGWWTCPSPPPLSPLTKIIQGCHHTNPEPFLTLIFLAKGSECLKMKILLRLLSASDGRLIFFHNPRQWETVCVLAFEGGLEIYSHWVGKLPPS